MPLPFLTTAELQEQGGAPVTVVPISIWPSGVPAQTDTGRAYDHEAEAPLDYQAELAVPNRQILKDGKRYRIVEAIAHPIVPHVALRLRLVRSGG